MRLKIDRERFEVRIDGKKIQLTNIQFDILEILHKADGRLVSRQQIMKDIWGWPKHIQKKLRTRIVDQHMSRLRRRLGCHRRPVIRTVMSRGYSIVRD